MTTKRRLRSICVWLMCLTVLLTMISTPALAVPRIDVDKDCEFTVVYREEDLAMHDVTFRIYRLADTDEYGDLTMLPAFKSMPVDLNTDKSAEEWQALALTMQSLMQTGAAGGKPVPADDSAVTDADGKCTFQCKPGLYLVCGDSVSYNHGRRYYVQPCITFLPRNINDDWEYEVEARPKRDPFGEVACRVLKVWNDAGYEAIRPDSLTVHLLCNNELFDTQELTEANGWRYDWGQLDPECQWVITEDCPEGYDMVMDQQGDTIIFTNTFPMPSPVADQLVIYKRVYGDEPDEDETFEFVITAQEDGDPMPGGVEGSVMTCEITGPGRVDVGEISFEKVGTYTYTVYEKNGKAEHWTYDDTLYTVTFIVTLNEEGVFEVEQFIEADDEAEDKIVFDNTYRKPEEDIPQTGQLWWPVFAMLVTGLLCLLVGFVRKSGSY